MKHARRLGTRAFRAETGEFLAEGPQAVREALGTTSVEGTDVVLEVFATADATARHTELAEAAGDRWSVVDDAIVADVADAVNPQGIVARCRSIVRHELPDTLDHVVICADVRDPGNAGAVIRCADAAGADAVVLAGDSVDPTNPKAVRATAGSLFHLPIVVERDTAAVVAELKSRGFQVLAADGGGDLDLFEADLSGPTAWLMGNEAWGLPPAVRALADHVVSVPIYGRAESLNLATAAAVCLYAAARVRHAPV